MTISKVRKRLWAALIGAVSLCAMVFCPSLGCGGPPGIAFVRIVHGALGLGDVSVKVQKMAVITQGVEGTISEYFNAAAVPDALVEIDNPTTHAVLAHVSASLTAGHHYSVLISGSNGQPKLDVEDDENGYFRFVNYQNAVSPLSITILKLPAKTVVLNKLTLVTGGTLYFKPPMPSGPYEVNLIDPNNDTVLGFELESISNVTVLAEDGSRNGEIALSVSASGADPTDLNPVAGETY
jgi:hypothetical protein